MYAETPRWLLRPLVAATALVVAVAAIRLARADRSDADALVASAAELGVAGRQLAELRQAVRREADPAERRLALARMLFPLSGQYRGPGVEARIARLELTERLAAESLRGLPASWQAASLLGSSRFESRKLRRDTRLFSAATEWELPLFAAVSRAAGSPMVERFLASAYLEVWPAMTESRRHQATETLRRSFADRRFSMLHFNTWIRVAGSYERAAEILPANFETWSRLAEHAVKGGAAEAAARYHRLAREQLLRELAWSLDEATRSDGAGRTWHLTHVVEQAPLGLDFVPTVESALTELQTTEGSLGLAAAAARWLHWAEPLCLVSQCPFEPATFVRLVELAGPRIGSPTAAFAALAAGRVERAEQIARRANAPTSEGWVSYGLLVAQRQLAAGERSAALEQLERLHRSARSRPVYASLLREAEGESDPESPPAEGPLARDAWSAGDWRGLDPANELELGAARPATAMRLQLGRRAPSNLLLQVELDGQLGPPVLVLKRATTVVVPIDLAPGVHLLRLRAPKGVRVEIERVSLE